MDKVYAHVGSEESGVDDDSLDIGDIFVMLESLRARSQQQS